MIINSTHEIVDENVIEERNVVGKQWGGGGKGERNTKERNRFKILIDDDDLMMNDDNFIRGYR